MGETPFDEVGPLDGMVGRFDADGTAPPIAQPGGTVHVSVAGVPEQAMGLADDIRLLVATFVERGSAAEQTAGGEPEQVDIALHGFTVEPEAADALRRRIAALVEQRTRSIEAPDR